MAAIGLRRFAVQFCLTSTIRRHRAPRFTTYSSRGSSAFERPMLSLRRVWCSRAPSGACSSTGNRMCPTMPTCAAPATVSDPVDVSWPASFHSHCIRGKANEVMIASPDTGQRKGRLPRGAGFSSDRDRRPPSPRGTDNGA
ncbi:protein of unknown function [Pararobbsia alpina]